MAQNLVFITGASSGIGLALARAVPYEDARVIDISRRGGPGLEHVKADLSDPTSWSRVGELFARELDGFAGQRVVFIHSAGTLSPMGFAGEVDPEVLQRGVFLNSVALQMLGDAFLRALAGTRAEATILNLGSGAAFNPYEGWATYCAGKAASDHWVRTVGLEQSKRGNRCRVVSIAPGVVETAMQEQIRAAADEDFPDRPKFVEMYEKGQLRTPELAAREIWELVGEDLENGAIRDLRERQGA